MKPITEKVKISEILDRGVIVDILPSKEKLIEAMSSGKRLKMYIGADPTSTSLHLSHAKNYMLLEEFRQLGHEVIVLFGDFTARIGDPSGRKDSRPQLSKKQITENVKGWVKQIKPLLNFNDKKNPPRIMYNSKWLSKLSFEDIIHLSSQFTVQQMLERDMFQKRLHENAPIYLHEFLYPLMQGYDSVAMDVDIELCGTDQTFNALAGRTLMRKLKDKEKFVVIVNLMENPKTHELMSKSRGTGVFLASPADDMYGALMAQPDEMTEIFFVNCTRIPLAQKSAVLALGPKAAKERIAFEIVKTMHGEKKAQLAQENFDKLFSKHEMPNDLPELKLKIGERAVIDIVFASGVVKSKGESRRLIEQGGFEIDGKVVKDPAEALGLKGGEAVKIGKKSFFRIKT